MKKCTLLLFFVASFIAACNEEKPKEENKDLLSTDLVNNPRSAEGIAPTDLAAMPTMDFSDTVHNFGNMKDGEVASYDFEFTNNGKNPLIISSAKGSCGCTVPEYPNEPIPPGKSGKLKVEFNSAGKEGHQEKSVTVTTNSKQGVHILFIKADVVK